jgi:hypothetical protein
MELYAIANLYHAGITNMKETETKVTSVNQDRQINLPPEIKANLQPGDEYAIRQSGNTIVLKKINKPLTFPALMQKIEALGIDPNQPTLEELNEIIKSKRKSNPYLQRI